MNRPLPRWLAWLVTLAVFVFWLQPQRAAAWSIKMGSWQCGGYIYQPLGCPVLQINHMVSAEGEIHFCLYFDGALFLTHRATWLEDSEGLTQRR